MPEAPAPNPTPEAVLRGQVDAEPVVEPERLEEISPEELRLRLNKYEASALQASQGSLEKRKFGLGARLLGKIIGQENLRNLADWTETTHAGKATKMVVKLAGGLTAITLAGASGLIFAGAAGAIATPLLYSLGGKKIAESAIEAIQEIAPTYIGSKSDNPAETGSWQWFGGYERREELNRLQTAKSAEILRLRQAVLAAGTRRGADGIELSGTPKNFNDALQEYVDFVNTSEGQILNGENRSLAEVREDFASWSRKWNTAKQIAATAATVGGLGSALAGGGLAVDLDLDRTKHVVQLAFDADPSNGIDLPEWVYDKAGSIAPLFNKGGNTALTAASGLAQMGIALGGLAVDAKLGYEGGLAYEESVKAAEINQNFTNLALKVPQAQLPRNPIENLNNLRTSVGENEVWNLTDPSGPRAGASRAGNYLIKERSGDKLVLVQVDDQGKLGATRTEAISFIQSGSNRVGASLEEYRTQIQERAKKSNDEVMINYGVEVGKDLNFSQAFSSDGRNLDVDKFYRVVKRPTDATLTLRDPDNQTEFEIKIEDLKSLTPADVVRRSPEATQPLDKDAEFKAVENTLNTEKETRINANDPRRIVNRLKENQVFYNAQNQEYFWISEIDKYQAEPVIKVAKLRKDAQNRPILITRDDLRNSAEYNYEEFKALIPHLEYNDTMGEPQQGGQPGQGGGGGGRRRRR